MKEMFVSNAGFTSLALLDDQSVEMLQLNNINVVKADGVDIVSYKLLKKFSTTGDVKTKDLIKSSPILKSQINAQ